MGGFGRGGEGLGRRQIDVLKIDQERDAITDSGVEVWNLLEQHKIQSTYLVHPKRIPNLKPKLRTTLVLQMF